MKMVGKYKMDNNDLKLFASYVLIAVAFGLVITSLAHFLITG